MEKNPTLIVNYAFAAAANFAEEGRHEHALAILLGLLNEQKNETDSDILKKTRTEIIKHGIHKYTITRGDGEYRLIEDNISELEKLTERSSNPILAKYKLESIRIKWSFIKRSPNINSIRAVIKLAERDEKAISWVQYFKCYLALALFQKSGSSENQELEQMLSKETISEDQQSSDSDLASSSDEEEPELPSIMQAIQQLINFNRTGLISDSVLDCNQPRRSIKKKYQQNQHVDVRDGQTWYSARIVKNTLENRRITGCEVIFDGESDSTIVASEFIRERTNDLPHYWSSLGLPNNSSLYPVACLSLACRYTSEQRFSRAIHLSSSALSSLNAEQKSTRNAEVYIGLLLLLSYLHCRLLDLSQSCSYLSKAILHYTSYGDSKDYPVLIKPLINLLSGSILTLLSKYDDAEKHFNSAIQYMRTAKQQSQISKNRESELLFHSSGFDKVLMCSQMCLGVLRGKTSSISDVLENLHPTDSDTTMEDYVDRKSDPLHQIIAYTLVVCATHGCESQSSYLMNSVPSLQEPHKSYLTSILEGDSCGIDIVTTCRQTSSNTAVRDNVIYHDICTRYPTDVIKTNLIPPSDQLISDITSWV